MAYHVDNAWWASPLNEKEEIRRSYWPGQKVTIHDATLRDGEQTPGVVFSAEDKFRIAQGLVEAGVTRIEAGMPAVSEADRSAIKRIAKELPQAEIFAFARATRGDVDMAADCGAKGVVIEVPIGYPKLKYQFNWTWEKVYEKSADCIRYAKEKGLYAVYFPYDATRANEDDVENLLRALMRDAAPTSVGVVDTMGCAMPQTIAYMVRWYKRLTNGLPVEVHTHNDFGMAVAAELAGVSAGAEVVHSCVNGLGERTGNAALEELILCMNILMGMDTPYKLEKLPNLCSMVEQISGIHAAPNKPFVGSRNYMRESGIGVDLVVKEPLAMFATDPRFFGRTAEIVLGKKSGKASITYYLEKMGKTASDEQVADLLAQVKAAGVQKKRLLTQEEFEKMVDATLD
ncbi:MAG: 2-isopropylmalate synthase [Clostridiales bacterium]|nr:2-isopropylmalate synthase [Clostridiales bacterium]MCI7705155.1 2-isopropylmalate synthase [Clostridiales bacterium]MDY4541268.1 2-isopropylmalate synthase [Candidatus Ventricola sp.]